MVGVNVAQVQPKPSAPAQYTGVAVWVPSKLSALKLAQRVDGHIAALRRFECEANTVIAMPKRHGQGRMQVVSRVQDGLMYSIQYPGLSFQRKDEVRKIRVRADGKVSEIREPRLKKPLSRPAGQMKIVKQASPVDWVTGHPGYIFGAVLGETPFTSLVRAASKPGSGYRLKVSERVIRRLNKPYLQYRLTVLRTGAAAKKSGAIQLETIVDAARWLPVTVFGAGDFKEKGKEPIRVANSLQWRVRRTPFDPKMFALRKSS